MHVGTNQYQMLAIVTCQVMKKTRFYICLYVCMLIYNTFQFFNVNSHASIHKDVHAKQKLAIISHIASANRERSHVKIGSKGQQVTVITLVALCGYVPIIVCTSIKYGLVMEC